MFLFSVCLPLWGFAQVVPVEITSVEFQLVVPRGASEAWWEAAIELAGRTREPTARDLPLEVQLELAFRSDAGEFRFYRARVGLLVPKAGDDVVARFYLPPGIVERAEIKGEPFAWRVALFQGGKPHPQERGSYSASLRNPEAARSFAQRIETDSPANDGWLQPIFLTPFFQADNGRLEDLPTYLRPEAAPRTGR